MPKLDGYGVCKAIKERCAAGRCSRRRSSSARALGEAADLERGFDAGADDYLVKPASPDELTSRIRALLVDVRARCRRSASASSSSTIRPRMRHFVADALARQGFAVTVADDGQAALERARDAERFDMIVTDYDMPRMTGFELVHALKRDPEAARDPDASC